MDCWIFSIALVLKVKMERRERDVTARRFSHGFSLTLRALRSSKRAYLSMNVEFTRGHSPRALPQIAVGKDINHDCRVVYS